jgi:hypothetical protein
VFPTVTTLKKKKRRRRRRRGADLINPSPNLFYDI